MIPRRRAVFLVLLVLCSAGAEETPPGLVSKDSDQDLQAEATQSGNAAQKREASLSNSYGEPLPPDAYGPPQDLINSIQDLPHPVPAPVYGPPGHQQQQQIVFQEQPPPPGAYGPPAPISFPSQVYHGPPPPPQHRHKTIYGPPKQSYGPPKQSYGPPKPVYGPPKYNPPKPIYGPPKKTYGPPKQSLPKPTYGVPFKPPKITLNKPIYGPPKPVYGPPKPVYGPPKPVYGPPIRDVQSLPLPELPQLPLPPLDNNNLDFGQNLPAPIYGTPLVSLPVDLKPNFPIPSDTYGPPGHVLGPIGPNDQIVVQNIGIGGGHVSEGHVSEVHISGGHIEGGNIGGGHYGPPQPDPNPQPPHPGIPAPPTPPHVLYDGWKPIPGVSHPVGQVSDQYGPPEQTQEIHINLDQSLPNVEEHHQFSSGSNTFLSGDNQFSSGGNQFSSDNHQILSGDHQLSSGNHDLSSGNLQFSSDNHDFSSGSHQFSSNNQHISSGAQITTGYANVHHDVHQDALANIDLNAIVGGDSNHIDQSKTVFEAHYTEGNHGPDVSVVQALPIANGKPFDTYGAPPIESLSNGPYPGSLRQQGAKGLIAPSGQYGVPPGSQYGAPPRVPPGLPLAYGQHSGGGHSGGSLPRHPIKFRQPVPPGLFSHIAHTTKHKDAHSVDHPPSPSPAPAYLPPPIKQTNSVSLSIEPSNLYSLPHSGPPVSVYGSPYDSYSVPLLTVGQNDHITSGSDTNAVTSTIDGTVLANLSNLDAAAILKHCPYHEAILRAARGGEGITPQLAASYVSSLNSLGSSLNSTQTKRDNYDVKSKSLKEKHTLRDQRLQYVSDQIQKTSERIRDLNEETKQLQQKIVSSSQNIQSAPTSTSTQLGSYSVQIQSSNGAKSSVPHDQLLSEGLLQSILQAIDDPAKPQQQSAQQQQQSQFSQQQQQQQQQFTQQQLQQQVQFTQQQQRQQVQEGQQQQQFKQQQQQQQVKQVQQQQQFNQQQQKQQVQQVHQQQQFSQQQQQIQQQQITQQQQQQLPQQQQQQLSQHQYTQTQHQQLAQQQHSFNQQSQQQLSNQQLPNNKYQNKFNSNVNLESFGDGLVLPAGYEPVDHSKNGDLHTQASDTHTRTQTSDTHKHTHSCDMKAEGSSKQEVAVAPPDDVAVYFGDDSKTKDTEGTKSSSEQA